MRRLKLARYGPSGAVTPGGVARVLAASAGLAVASALLVVGVEAAAAGSGIPEAKAYLNGVNYSRYLALRCGAVKAVAVVLSVASGLVVGREGPLIHVGAVVCGVVRRRRRSRDVAGGRPRTASHRRVR